MTRSGICFSSYVALLAFSLTTSFALADTLDINYIDRGWYKVQGMHNPFNQNYTAGDARQNSFCTDDCSSDNRNFFVFDLSAVTQPITSAKLALTLGVYNSPDTSEFYELHDVTTSIPTLRDGGPAGATGVAIWNDLGTGVVYGSRVMSVGDSVSVIEIPLNSSAISAMNSTSGLFAIGGSITTLDNLVNREYAFGFTDLAPVTELRLTLVPEPSSLFLLAIGAVSLIGRWRTAK